MKFDLFSEALAVLKPMQAQLAGDFNACNSLAFVAWVRDDVDLCRWASHRCIGLDLALLAGYDDVIEQEIVRTADTNYFIKPN